MIVLAYGAGTDSTGILVGWKERGLQETDPIVRILFADTGGERPETYAYIHDVMQPWLAANGFPPITIVRKGGIQETLEENCLRKNMLPSLAYGFKSCSQKFKVGPQDVFFNNDPAARDWWARGQLVTKLIGYEAREEKRWKNAKRSDGKYEYEFPLVDWGWNRAECQAAILRAGLPLPGKSACFFCPASTVPEIKALARNHPTLWLRAIIMEGSADLTSIKGLGRRMAWRELDYTTDMGDDEQHIEPCQSCIDH
jgi:hypothetical protein